MSVNPRVLIVDDNLTNIEILEEIFEDLYELKSVDSGKEALAVAPKFRPHLVLLDIMMPVMDGYEVCKRMREISQLKNTKIIMVSAKAMVSERLKGYEVGADDYVTKPFNKHEILAKAKVFVRLGVVEETNQVKNELFQMFDKETNNPLRAILSPLHTLLKDEDEDLAQKNQERTISTILEAVKDVDNFLEKVLMICGLKSEKISLNLKEANLCSIVRNSIHRLNAQAAEAQITIKESLPSSVFSNVNERQMEFSISAILETALKMSPENSEISIGITKKNAWLELSIKCQNTDFHRHASSQSMKTSNINAASCTDWRQLGLVIAQHIVSFHKGKMDINKQDGTSTNFTIQLPTLETSQDSD